MQVIKAIVASPVHAADGLIPVAVRVSHLHLPQRTAVDLKATRKGDNAKTLEMTRPSWRNIVFSSLPLPPPHGFLEL